MSAEKPAAAFMNAARKKPLSPIPDIPGFRYGQVTCLACLAQVGAADDGTPLPHLRIPGGPDGDSRFESCPGGKPPAGGTQDGAA